MAKYTDEQIKKALGCCEYGDYAKCHYECPYKANCSLLTKDALNLINRQEAEIERLKEKNRLACQCTPKAIRRAKSEVIKEFAERLKEHCGVLAKDDWNRITSPSSWASAYECFADDIDNLAKEMVGESE